MSIIIGITGRAKSGKNQAASAIEEVSIRSGLKTKVYEISHYILEDLKKKGMISPDAERNNLSHSEIKKLVLHGNWGREESPVYWIRKVQEDIFKDDPDVAILPNIRFVQEGTFIKMEGNPGYVIRVRTLISDNVDYISLDRDPNDPTETEQSKIDADFFITTKRGNADLTSRLAQTTFQFIIGDRHGNIPELYS